MFTIPYAKRQAIIAALTGVGKPLGFAGLKVGLLIGEPFDISTRLVRATVITQDATFHGYTAGGDAPTAWGSQYKDAFDNVYQDLIPMNEWVASDDVVDETVWAYYVDDGTNVYVEKLAAPIRVKAQGNIVRVQVTFAYGQ